MSAADPHATVDAIWRVEAPKIIGGLTRLVRDLATAEDLAHDALVAALEQWPAEGVPSNPGAPSSKARRGGPHPTLPSTTTSTTTCCA